jgi:uncharacterized repeat protein (TIGR03847 family)
MGEVEDFGRLVSVNGEAIGPPGQRRFRLCLLGDGRSAACWLEKEQLAALGEAIEQALRDQGYQYVPPPPDDATEKPVFPLSADIEFVTGRLSIGLDPGEQILVVTAGDPAPPDDPDSHEVRGAFSFEQGYELAQEIREVVAAGRKPCPLCSAPMDPGGHMCVKRNGHRSH